MKLKHNSISARLYRWFYMTEQMPQTLCPYFWKLVIMWIFIVPVYTVCLPMTISDKISKDDTKLDEWFPRIIINLLLWFMLFLVATMIFSLSYFIWGMFPKESIYAHIQLTGIMGWFGSIIIGLVLLTIHIAQKRKEMKRRRMSKYVWDENGDYVTNPDYVEYEEKPNIIIEFIKAKYNKYCPKINWE